MDKLESVRVSGEGFVVTEAGVRVDGQVHTSESVAQVEAAKRQKKLQEQAGATPAPRVEIKKQLFG